MAEACKEFHSGGFYFLSKWSSAKDEDERRDAGNFKKEQEEDTSRIKYVITK